MLSQCYRNELILVTIVLEWQQLMSFVWRLITATKYSNIVSISNNTSTSYYIYGINIATTNAVFSPSLACTQVIISPSLVPRPCSSLASYPGYVLT